MGPELPCRHDSLSLRPSAHIRIQARHQVRAILVLGGRDGRVSGGHQLPNLSEQVNSGFIEKRHLKTWVEGE